MHCHAWSHWAVAVVLGMFTAEGMCADSYPQFKAPGSGKAAPPPVPGLLLRSPLLLRLLPLLFAAVLLAAGSFAVPMGNLGLCGDRCGCAHPGAAEARRVDAVPPKMDCRLHVGKVGMYSSRHCVLQLHGERLPARGEPACPVDAQLYDGQCLPAWLTQSDACG